MPRFLLVFILFLMSCNESPKASLAPSSCTILFLGTSLTAGYGLDPDMAFPALLANRLADSGRPFAVINAGVPGETSAGLRERLERVLTEDSLSPGLIVIETGANDMLQFMSPTKFAENLRFILDDTKSWQPKAAILLLRVDPGGARHLPGQGANGGLIMDSLSTIADEYNIPVLDDLLEGVRLKPEFTQDDRLHPNALGYERVADNIWPTLIEVLDQAGCRAQD